MLCAHESVKFQDRLFVIWFGSCMYSSARDILNVDLSRGQDEVMIGITMIGIFRSVESLLYYVIKMFLYKNLLILKGNMKTKFLKLDPFHTEPDEYLFNYALRSHETHEPGQVRAPVAG